MFKLYVFDRQILHLQIFFLFCKINLIFRQNILDINKGNMKRIYNVHCSFGVFKALCSVLLNYSLVGPIHIYCEYRGKIRRQKKPNLRVLDANRDIIVT